MAKVQTPRKQQQQTRQQPQAQQEALGPSGGGQQRPVPTPLALAVARYLRHHPDLKSKPAVVNGSRVEYFRVKRALRALMSDEYKAKRKDPLPEITSKEDAIKVLAQLPMYVLALRVERPADHDGHDHGPKPSAKGKAGREMEIVREQAFGDDMHYAWFWHETSMKTYLLAFGMVVLLLAAVMFPLWPAFMRTGAWYLSILGMAFIVFLIVTSIVRLVVYVVTYFTAKPGIWIFPNLFEDVGFFESFVPLYAWDIKVKKKRKSKDSTK